VLKSEEVRTTYLQSDKLTRLAKRKDFDQAVITLLKQIGMSGDCISEIYLHVQLDPIDSNLVISNSPLF